jgi:hypothetical protein
MPAFGRKSEARNPKSETMTFNKPNLKKQSQFLKGHNVINSALTMVYGNVTDWTLGENKPNSKPILVSPQIFWGLRLKKQSQFAKLAVKGAEQVPPNAHMKDKQRISEKSYRKVVKSCSG